MCILVCVCVCVCVRCSLSGSSACFPKWDMFGGGSGWVLSYLAVDHRMGDVETGVT